MFTYLKSKFMIITDHIARPVTVIGCLARSHYGGTNHSCITQNIPSFYTASFSSQEKGLVKATVVNGVQFEIAESIIL